MTDCLITLYPAWRQYVIAIFFLDIWCAKFFRPAVWAQYNIVGFTLISLNNHNKHTKITHARTPPNSGMGHLRIFPEFRIFFLPPWKKNLSPASWLFFCLGKIGGIIRHYCRPATKYKISRSIRISRFHVWKSQVFVFFRNWKKKKASHFVACLQAHKTWAKNKFYDRLNWRPWLNPLHTATQRVR